MLQMSHLPVGVTENEEVGQPLEAQGAVEFLGPCVDGVDGKSHGEPHRLAVGNATLKQCAPYAASPELRPYGKAVKIVFALTGFVLHAGKLYSAVLLEQCEGAPLHVTVEPSVVGSEHAGTLAVIFGNDGVACAVEHVVALANEFGERVDVAIGCIVHEHCHVEAVCYESVVVGSGPAECYMFHIWVFLKNFECNGGACLGVGKCVVVVAEVVSATCGNDLQVVMPLGPYLA